jgi:hypothetical protein
VVLGRLPDPLNHLLYLYRFHRRHKGP